jgi:hypothetical protein
MIENDTNPYSPPEMDGVVPAEPEHQEDGKKMLFLGGILLLVNSALVLAERLLLPNAGQAPFGGIAPAIIDIVLAVSFLGGNPKWKGFAIFRIVAGLLLVGGMNIANGDYFTPVFALVGYGGLLLVLIGQASRVRGYIGAGLFGLFVVLEIIGLLVLS